MDDMVWQNDESAGPENDDFSEFRPSRPRFFWGRGYGPSGPPNFQRPAGPPNFQRPAGPPNYQRPGGPPNFQGPSEKNDTMTFLIRCGVVKQTLKGLPKTLLRLMEPEYCGICAQGFHQFDEARLHYNSKNHIRNQKKWLAQQATLGSHRPIEIPLKSRDLYCELCDVHITSKIHATSHYAGRSHRAIVEGRKAPKNPYLLQNYMQDRVRQLIRREKKNLAPIEVAESTTNVEADTTPIAPELYCDICKISVTCTEQLTMHLNGKKHLTKEKRHILNVMKGEKTEHADVQGEDDPNKGETNYHEDEFDWGQGSGKWDDDPQ